MGCQSTINNVHGNNSCKVIINAVCSPEPVSTDMFKPFEEQINSVNLSHVETFQFLPEAFHKCLFSSKCIIAKTYTPFITNT